MLLIRAHYSAKASDVAIVAVKQTPANIFPCSSIGLYLFITYYMAASDIHN